MIFTRKIIKGMIFVIPAAIGILWFLGNERVLQISFHNRTGQTQNPAPPATKTQTNFNTPSEFSITKKISDQIAKDIIAKNPAGPAIIGDKPAININPGEVIEKLVESVQTSDKTAESEFDVPLKDLSVIYSNDLGTKKQYFSEFQRIIKETLDAPGQPTIFDAFEKIVFGGGDAELREISKRHEAAILAMKKLAVPAELIPLHKSEIALIAKTKAMVDGMLAYTSDPLRAYIAFQIYPKLQDEASALQKEFIAYVTKEKISYSL